MTPSPTSLVAQALKHAHHVLILTDERIDGDTLGASIGLFHTLTHAEIRATIFSPKPIPPAYHFLPEIAHFSFDARIFSDPSIDLIVVCDCADGTYLPPLLATCPRAVPLVCFDHHSTNPHYGTYNLIEPQAHSTADVVYRFLLAEGFFIPPAAAQGFLTGICTDTLLFSTEHTRAPAFTLAAELIARGGVLAPIVRNTMMRRTAASFALWGRAFSRLNHDPDLDALVTGITEQDIIETKATQDDVSSLSSYLHEVLDASHDAVLVYVERPDGSVKGSLRSTTRNVALLAQERFGGGGHPLAAGFTVPRARLLFLPSGLAELVRDEREVVG